MGFSDELKPLRQSHSVELPTVLLNEICTAFPVDGGHHRTRAAHHRTRQVICLLLGQGQRDKRRLFGYNAQLLEAITSRRCREQVKVFLSQCRFTAEEIKYKPGEHCTYWRLVGSYVRVHGS